MIWIAKNEGIRKMGEAGQETERSSIGQLFGLFLLLLMFGLAFWASGLPEGTLWQQWDKIVHTLSGAALTLIFFRFIKSVPQIALFVFLIGALFEVAEFIVVPFGLYGDVDRYIIDTTLDLIVDVLGAVIMLQLIRLKQHA